MVVYSTLSDQELTALLKQGSEPAFRYVFDSWHKKLYHFSLRYLNSRQQAEEAVHDTMLSFWNSRQRLDNQYPIGAFA